jgi:predicted ATPase/DNA-binding SARP family transcriptional activator/DNA-binding CsgD family transcriptional regulator
MCPPAGSEGMTQPEASTGERPETVRIWLLGGFRVSVGSRTIQQDEWRLRKAASLVKLLALAPGHRLHREQVMYLLWPNSATRAASNNLRQVLYAARRVLDPASDSHKSCLSLQDEQLILGLQVQLWVDIEAFEESALSARRSRDPAAYRAAIDIYAGDLLPEDRYEGWTEGRREELRQLYLALLIELAGLYEERDEHVLAIEALRKATAKEPTFEEAHATLMRLHALSGRPEQAVVQYERLREALSKQLGTEPGATTRALHAEIAARRFPLTRPAAAPPPQEPLDVGNYNLPAARTNFVGREREMIEVKRMLAMTGLLTLTGAGGSGKTRLALEVARSLIGTYPDGVWLVELAPLSERALVPQVVAEALGVAEQPGRPMLETLLDALRGKETLLILDNCEHLIDAAARLTETLLDSCPRLRVLATSREALNVAGEAIWHVGPLSVPRQGERPTVEELEGYESAQLFVERALFVERILYGSSGFALGSDNASAVAEICWRLEGIPLAIELAAAWVGTLTIEQISERLKVSLGLLKGGRTVTRRQQTLRGAMDWSYDLLGEPEQILFRRLSVFAGGWTLEAAEAVGAGGNVGEEEVLELLWRLVNKSLVAAEARTEGTARYRMLEPIRQYAQEKLAVNEEAKEVQGRHAEFFLALAEEAKPRLLGQEEATWLGRLEAEHDNLRAALSWSLGGGDLGLGLRLTGALGQFWHTRGLFDEGRRWLEEALAKDGPASVAARARALEAVGWTAFNQGDMERAVTAAEESLKLSAEAAIEVGVAASLRHLLANVSRIRGEYEKAAELYEESLTLNREAEDMRSMVWSLQGMANVETSRGNYERAAKLLEESLILCRESGYTDQLGSGLSDLGYVLLLRGEHERATTLNEEAASLYRKRGHRSGLEYALDNLGWAALMRGDHERAKTLHEESLELSRELGVKAITAESIEGLACAAGARGEAERAARLFGAAWALHEALGYQQTPRERALREPYLAAARSRLDEASWDAAFAEGQEMTFEEAVEYTLSKDEETDPSATPVSKELSVSEPLGKLTRREQQVALLVARGLTNRQISTELGISERTAGNHVAKILRKLGLRSRAQIATWVTES